MRGKTLAVLVLAASIGFGCASGAQLKANKDNSWNDFPAAMPGPHDATAGGYGHPFRGLAFALHPVGVALDYVLIRPFYLLGGLAPEWFGVESEDAVRYHDHLPELVNPRTAPRRFD